MEQLSGNLGSRAEMRFFAVCRRNGQRRVEAGREWWTVPEWREFIAAAKAAGYRGFGIVAKVEALLERGAGAEEIALEVASIGSLVEATQRRNAALERDAALARRAAVAPPPRRRARVDEDER